MNRNFIFLDKSLESNLSSTIFEIANYIIVKDSQKSLNVLFYSDILLFIAEFLPTVKEQNKWIGLGYRICRQIKDSLENYGHQYRTAMLGGLGFQCFAINVFSQEANMLNNFSKSIHKVLLYTIDKKLRALSSASLHDSDYDLVCGISGSLYYLLDFDYTKEEKQILAKCAEYLVSLASDTEFDGKPITKFHILQPNQNPNFDQGDYKDGNINFGLAHGMLGPLIALAKAYSKGICVNGMEDAIQKIYNLYECFQVKNEFDISYWPALITVDEYWNKRCKQEHIETTASWCYGNIGIMRGLQKVARYMNWTDRELVLVNAMSRFFEQEIDTYELRSPSLCHGFSSLIAVQTCAYNTYKNPKLLINLERNVQRLLRQYRKSNSQEINLMDIITKKNLTEGYLKDLSLMTGSIGIAITLLSFKKDVQSWRLLMID